MKPKNVMLLGFVNKAVKYLDRHLDDGSSARLTELRNIDLENIKNDLSHNLDQSLGVAQSTINTLLQIGEDVFDDFISVHDESDKLSNEINRIFDLDFDDEEDKEDRNELEKLLSFYNLDNSFDIDEIKEEEVEEDLSDDGNYVEIFNINNYHKDVVENIKEDEDVKYVEIFNINDLLDDGQSDEYDDLTLDVEQSIENETNQEKQVDDENYVEIFNIENYNNSLINLLQETPNDFESVEALDIDNLLDDGQSNEYDDLTLDVEQSIENETNQEKQEEVIAQLDNIVDELEQVSDQEDEPVFEMSDEDNELLKLIAENVENSNELSLEEEKDDDQNSDNQELDNIFSEVVAHEEEPEEEIIEEVEDTLPEQVDRDDIIKLLQEIQVSDDHYYGRIQDFTIEDAFGEQEEEIVETNEEETFEEDVYVSSLIDDLRKQMIEEDERKRAIEEEYRVIYDRIHKLYPYLASDFIRTVYDLKQSIIDDYPLNKRIIILHRCIFKDLENLRQFVEICLNHGYSINAAEDKMIVDVFKEYVNTDGKIITTIFEIANQSALLNGEYDGYRVMLVEKA